MTWDNLPPLFPREALHPAVLARVDAGAADGATGNEVDGRGAAGEIWCVAFSGGADSLALLLMLHAHWPERRGKLRALHFNHRLRGAESDGDEAFCRDVCEGLSVELRVGSWAEARDGASEAEAREARRGFFSREMAEIGARVLWTGHQKDDVAETLLMRLARGSGAAGLAAPRPVQTRRDGGVVLRPLLTLEKAEIVGALRAAGVVWREDASNAAGDFFRNRVRNDVVPAWRAAAVNDALAGAALTRELLAEDDAALDAWLDELVPAAVFAEARETLDLRALIGRPRALWRRALRRWAPLAELARASFEDVLASWERGQGRVNAGAGWVTIAGGRLVFSEAGRGGEDVAWSPQVLVIGGAVRLPDGAVLEASRVEFSGELRERVRAGDVDPAREAFIAVFDEAFTVRPWSAGDRYRPLGAPGSAKLQDLFVNRKIPAQTRLRLPVVCGWDGEILWIPFFPPAEKSKMADESVTGVRLTYHIGTNTVHPQSLRVNV